MLIKAGTQAAVDEGKVAVLELAVQEGPDGSKAESTWKAWADAEAKKLEAQQKWFQLVDVGSGPVFGAASMVGAAPLATIETVPMVSGEVQNLETVAG